MSLSNAKLREYMIMRIRKLNQKYMYYLGPCNSKGDRIAAITAVDSTYNHFDRIVIHGGQPYFIDDIKIITT